MFAAPDSVRLAATAIDSPLRDAFSAVRRAMPDAYLVGGGVRDLLRGASPADLDFVTAGDVAAAAGAIAKALGGSAFALDAERAQYRVAFKPASRLRSIDLSPLAGDIEADLRRRDFTVNAIAAPVEPDGGLGELIDPCGGAADIAAQLLRMTGAAALRDDPLRMLRAVRLAVELDFAIEGGTAAAIRELAGLIVGAAAERQREELTRMLATARGAAALRLLDGLGLLAQVLPELMPARGVEQPGEHHYWDVFDHSIETLATLDALLAAETPADEIGAWMRADLRQALADFPLDEYLNRDEGGHSYRVLIKLAGLLHDVAKPETKGIAADGRIRFLGHPELGATKSARICERLRFSNRESRFVALLVEEHLRPTQLAPQGEPPSRRALFRFFRDLEDAAPACLLLMLADGASAAGPRLTRERWRDRAGYAAAVLAEGREGWQAIKAKRLVTGDDLIEALGLAPGPELGQLLSAVEEAIGAGEVTTREAALAYARGMIAEGERS